MALTLLAANNAQTVLAAGINATATTLTVNTGTGNLFPAPVAGTSFFKLTLVDSATGSLTEIVHVTARVGDTMTIARAQEGTTARIWSANDIAANMLTAGTLQLYAQKDQALLIDNNLSEIAAAGPTAVAQALANLGLGASAFGFKNCVVFSTAGVSNWTVPDELKSGRKAKVTVIGGGGSGGRGFGGGGGGGGGLAVKMVDLTGVATVAITVGAGGVAPAAGSSTQNGTPGSSSSFGTFCSATGGGSGGIPSSGSVGVGTGGDLNTSTGPGSPGNSYNAAYNSGSGGGPGGAGVNSGASNDGQNAVGPGGGGSGATFGSSAVSCRSGSGFSGIVIIEW